MAKRKKNNKYPKEVMDMVKMVDSWRKIQYPFILCDCYSHALHLDFDQETDNELHLSIWERSPGYSKMALRERLRWIWRILITGRPFTDQIILDGPKIKLLRDKLNVICDKLDESVKNADKL